MAFSPDGKHIAATSHDRMVRVWDAQTGQQALSLKGHTSEVRSVVFSPDGRSLASGDASGRVCLWDATTGALIAWRPFEGTIRALWFHPEGSQLSIADDGGATFRPRVYLLEIVRPNR